MTTSETSSAPVDVPPDVAIPTEHPAVHMADSPTAKRSDRWLIAGALLFGTAALAPVGLVLIGVGLSILARARRAGEQVRPLAVTIFGLFILCDAALNFVGWSFDLMAHDTHLVSAMTEGVGKMVDGGYYLRYNSTFFGGTAAPGEKALQMFSVLVIFPSRFVAAWAFLKLRRWGLRWTIFTSWAYIILWLGYMTNIASDFDGRMGASLYGVAGWWVFDICYITPFIALPWLYALDKRRWDR